MFELSVASKYLLPRKRQLSVSIISLISILVIALVVWLVVVFFSVTEGLEKNWVNKLTALTAPIRATPTEAYYKSYYYLIDSISENANYSLKTLSEKIDSPSEDPYNPEIDQEIPLLWPLPDLNQDQQLKDPVKLFFTALQSIPNVAHLRANPYEVTTTQLSLDLHRPGMSHSKQIEKPTHLFYQTYLTNFEENNPQILETLLPLRPSDLNNLLFQIEVNSADHQASFQANIREFFQNTKITRLKPQQKGWVLPRALLPENFEWNVVVVLKKNRPLRAIIPFKKEETTLWQKQLEAQGLTTATARLIKTKNDLILKIPGHLETKVSEKFPLLISPDNHFKATIDVNSLEKATRLYQLLFQISFNVQQTSIKGTVPYRGLEFVEAEKSLSLTHSTLPKNINGREGILLPKSFYEAGILVGDAGFVSYLAPTTSLMQQQKIPVYIAGFYDPGIIPIGGKFILANRAVVSLVHASYGQEETHALTNGINIRLEKLEQVDAVKKQLQEMLKQQGVDRYWKIQTYKDYEFTKEIMQELQSQKNLFMLISIVIIIVACSNIISMLIILVNDKKLEIGILRSMGATSASIAFIFALSGTFIGMVGSLIGTAAGIFTLHHLNELTTFLSYLQGYEMFNASLYGETLPNALSWKALSFVFLATVCLSLLAGIVPAIKACLLRPSQIFRNSGG